MLFGKAESGIAIFVAQQLFTSFSEPSVFTMVKCSCLFLILFLIVDLDTHPPSSWTLFYIWPTVRKWLFVHQIQNVSVIHNIYFPYLLANLVLL